MAELLEKPAPWVFEDLQEIPERLRARWRFEIVDGGLEVSPAPSVRHEVVCAGLTRVLDRILHPRWLVLGPVGVAWNSTCRIPDRLVVDPAVVVGAGATLRPADIAVAIEVVSPGSITRDRITKPTEYAAAGIPAYWRVETDGDISMTAYALRAGDTVYRELGAWSEQQQVTVTEPFEVSFGLAELTA